MQSLKVVTALSLLIAVSGCEHPLVNRQQGTASANEVVASRPSEGPGDLTTGPNGQTLPYPAITKQTFIPPYSLFAHTKCHAWRIEWPLYPAGTDPNKIPTVFTLSNGGLNSFYYLNNVSASNTYKTNFNLFHDAQLETANTLWDELIYTFEAGDQMETTWFNKTNVSAKTIEHWVKERPSLFENNWVDNNQEPPVYQQGDFFLFKLIKPMNQYSYGGIRIVSMTPRIIEVYLAVPNS